MQDRIIIKGAREHNLKNVSLELPRGKMIVMTGLSGSGKSSLAFDTIFAEGQRRYVESLSAYARQFLGQMDKPDVDEIEGLSPAISIDQKAHSANPRSTVATITEVYDYLRVLFARIGKPHCVLDGREISKLTVEQMVDAIVRKTVAIHAGDGATKRPKGGEGIAILAPVVRGRKGEYHQLLYDLYNAGFSEVRVDGKFRSLRNRLVLSRYKQHTIELLVDRVPIGWPVEGNKPFRTRLAEAIEIALDRGDGVIGVIFDDASEMTMSSKYACPDDGFSFPEIEPRLFSFNSPYGACERCHGLGLEAIWSSATCPKCGGKRLRDEALAVTVGGKNIVEVTAMPISEAVAFFDGLELTEVEREIAEAIMKEVKGRLRFMLDVGLDYLTLNRIAGTLSGGEAQRIRLASQIGSRLVGALYVLDEPTIGLHQRDNARLIETLEALRDLGNTIIVVEHDEDTIGASDHMVDIGPGAGKLGGEIIVAGPTGPLLSGKPGAAVQGDPKKSLTLKYLRGEERIPIPERRKESREKIVVKGASENNLKGIDVEIPLRRFVCLTGVSGSGKSSLMTDTIYPAISNRLNLTRHKVGKHKEIKGLEYLDKVIDIDQSPIGRTPRSNPATYTGAWTHIRELFSETAEARIRGYKPGRFSFNVPGGRCENCQGNGMIAIEMHFLPTVYVTCDVCRGKRFDRETLEVKYNNKSIHDVLAMTVAEADVFFRDVPFIHDKFRILSEVGLDYLELGQSATTLSGGEAQRVKLGAELARRQTGRTLYLLDEPTVGLHFDDVRKLLEVIQRLVGHGNTVLVIEHNLDVIKCADWVIDLGPEGGDKGGTLIAAGTPEDIARKAGSYTGQYLKKTLR